jgi:hypothetical protein
MKDGKPATGGDLPWAASQGQGRHNTQLMVSILNALDIPDQTFGDPKAMQGPLPKLLG